MRNRICVVWNSKEDPMSAVLDVSEKVGKTQAVLTFLRDKWGWNAGSFDKHCEEIRVLDLDDEEEPEDDVQGTVAVFMNREPVSALRGNRVFSRLIDILEGDKTVKEVLFKEGVGNTLHDENLTFEIPDELKVDVYCCVGYPLLIKEVSGGHILTTTIIGFVIPIDKELAAALKTFGLNDFWTADDRVVWSTEDADDFSCHLQALCEKHEVGLPVPLE